MSDDYEKQIEAEEERAMRNLKRLRRREKHTDPDVLEFMPESEKWDEDDFEDAIEDRSKEKKKKYKKDKKDK